MSIFNNAYTIYNQNSCVISYKHININNRPLPRRKSIGDPNNADNMTETIYLKLKLNKQNNYYYF